MFPIRRHHEPNLTPLHCCPCTRADPPNSRDAPLTRYAAGGFVARAGADYVVRGGTFPGLGAGAGVVGTRLV